MSFSNGSSLIVGATGLFMTGRKYLPLAADPISISASTCLLCLVCVVRSDVSFYAVHSFQDNGKIIFTTEIVVVESKVSTILRFCDYFLL